MQDAISLFELNKYIKQVVSLNFDEPVWVKCEISQIRQSKGHYYLELIEKSSVNEQVIAQMGATIWAGDYMRIAGKLGNEKEQILKNGAAVQLLVEVTFHERYGLKFNIRDVDLAFPLGQFEQKRREILLRLQAEGLIGLNEQTHLPLVAQRVAVISSEQAAGYQDFRTHLGVNPYGFHFEAQLFQASMQGASVSGDVIKQLQKIDTHYFDCVVIIRGGGSRIDLSDFDSYELGKVIANYPIPVLTGIGHEIDISTTDMVAWKSFKTPTAVADFLISRARDFEVWLNDAFTRLVSGAFYLVQNEKEITTAQINKLRYLSAQFTLRKSEQLNYEQKELAKLSRLMIKDQLTLISHMEKSLSLLDYKSVLRRGFSLLTDLSGKPVVGISGLKTGQEIVNTMADGKIYSSILTTETNE
jgi:exodeoxyribonuclease VII large subunit